jgi:hypothetical protein
VSEEPDLVTACKRLIDRANENGGPDNITVIAARFDGEGLEQPANDDAIGHRTFPLATDSGQMPAAERLESVGTATTGAVAAVRRPTAKLAPDMLAPDMLAITEADTAEVSARRRTRGSLIALVLLLVFLGGATWWVYHTAQQVVAPRHGGSPTPTDPRP